jgi:hypothetical protein
MGFHEHALILFGGPVRELIVTDFPGVIFSIKGANASVIFTIFLFPCSEIVKGTVAFIVASIVLQITTSYLVPIDSKD